MHGAILSTSSSTSQARSGGTGTVKEWSISMAMVRHTLSGWLQSVNYARYRSASAKTPVVRRASPRRGSRGVQHPEAFGQASPGQAGLPGHEAQPGPDALGQVLHVPGLALVRTQRGDLAREGLGHVHVVVRVGAARDPDLAHDPGGQRLALEQLGKRER